MEKETRERLEKKWPKYIIVDKYGWPVAGIENRPITSFLRKIIHGRGIITRERWVEYEMQRMSAFSDNVGGEAAPITNIKE